MAPTTPLTISHLADQVHHASSGLAGASIVLIGRHQPTPVIEWWEIPTSVAHPGDALIGWLAGPQHDVIGLVTSGTTRPLASPGDPPPVDTDQPIRLTHLVGRDHTTASVLEGVGRATLIETPPEGLVADAMRRTLGLPTPDPELSLAALVEAGWLDAIAEVAFAGSTRVQTWDQVARLHPLAGRDHTPSAGELAREVRELVATSSWSRLRARARVTGFGTPHPPSGHQVEMCEWFDDGSFARWSTRNLPDPFDLLAAVLETVPLSVGAQICQALTDPSVRLNDLDPPGHAC